MLEIESPRCPECKDLARGILATVPGVVLIDFDLDAVGWDGPTEADYEGHIDMDWNNQEAVTDGEGNVTLTCCGGHQWKSKMTIGGIPPEPTPSRAADISGRSVLAELAGKQRALADSLFSNMAEMLCSNPSDAASCVQKEETRPLSSAEIKHGWASRPFWAYDSNNMCLACRSYFYAERAAQTLHEKVCLDAKYKSQRPAKGDR